MTVSARPRSEYKTLPIERVSVKATSSGAREFTGYASRWDDVDWMGDIVRRGAFSATLQQRAIRPLLWNHDAGLPIGVEVELVEDRAGLRGAWRLSKSAVADDAYALLRDGAVTGLSIGFIATETKDGPDGTRELLGIELLEVSLVALPALDSARVLDVKSARGAQTMNVAQRMAARGLAPVSPLARSIGQRLTQSAEYKRLVADSSLHSEHSQIRLKLDLPGVSIIRELKALTISLANTPDVRAEQMLLTPPEFGLIDVLPTFPTESNNVEIVTSTVTNNAAMVAEATASTGTTGTKPESAITYTGVMAPPQVVSHWLPVTRQVLADAPTLEGSINTELLWGLRAKLEDQAVNGDGTAPNLRGILNWSGVLTQSAAGLQAVEALVKAVVAVRSTSRRMPTIIAVNTTSWGALMLARQNTATGTLGGYQLGDPDGGAPSLWGIPIVPSDALPAGTALVGAAATAALYEREAGAIKIGTIGQQFVRNMVTVLAEARVALGVSRPQAWCIVSGLPS